MLRKNNPKLFHRCGSDDEVVEQLTNWYRTPLGQMLVATEKTNLDNILPTLFGYHLVQIGQYGEMNLLQSSKVSHCTVMQTGDHSQSTHALNNHFVGKAYALPIMSDSVDVLMLNHALEFSSNPHQVLREVERVLVPEGHVVIMMFNPWSLWAINRMIFSWRKTAPWCGNFIGATRSKDWLALLGFEVIQTRGYFFRPALQQASVMERLSWFDRLGSRFWSIFGGGYMLVAKKKIETITPIRPKWTTRRRRVVAAGLVESMDSWRKKVS